MALGAFRPTATTHQPRAWHAAVLLDDGRALVIGGMNNNATVEQPGAEIFVAGE